MRHPEPVANRLLASLPAVYREADRGVGEGDLQTLLGAFERVLIGTHGATRPEGYEQCVAALPSLLSPEHAAGGFDAETRDAFVPWLAARWVAFTPFAHFDAYRLRRIVAGIVPLYARRGTPAYLVELLRLCFDEITDIDLREHLSGGLVVGEAVIGVSTWLGSARAFSFGVQVRLRAGTWSAHALAALAARLRAVVDFAKPAHTTCDLIIHARPGDGVRGGHDASISA